MLSSNETKGRTNMKSITKSGLKVRVGIKSGGFTPPNHNRSGLKVRAGVRSGGFTPPNHNQSGLRVRTAVKAGAYICRRNHSRKFLAI